jgi:hypothetical protein
MVEWIHHLERQLQDKEKEKPKEIVTRQPEERPKNRQTEPRVEART